MTRLFRLFALLVFLSALTSRGAENFDIIIENLTPESEVQHDQATDTWTGFNGVVVRSPKQDLVITADAISYHEKTGAILADGNVRIRRGAQSWVGDKITYNLTTREMSSDYFRAGIRPFFFSGYALSGGQTNGIYETYDATLTSDDVSKPFFRIRAKELKIKAGKTIEAKGASVWLGNTPVMYFPFYSRSLVRHPNNFSFVPGYRSLYGPFLLSSYNWYFNDHFDGSLHFDMRQKRGLAGGPEVNYDLGRWGRGNALYYYTRDDRPGVDLLGAPIRRDRERVDFTYDANLRTNLTAKIGIHQQSDVTMIRDFFEWDYRKNQQPRSFAEINQAWPNWTLDALAQPQINTFFETVERLPDVKLTGLRQQLGVSPFYYESESSAAYLRFRSASSTGTNYSATRADTYHQIVLPKTFFGWLNVTPRVGGRFTYYGEADGLGPAMQEENRGVFNTGVETSFKASRVWTDARNKFFDVEGVRHIIEPSINYVYVPSPNVPTNQIPQFDRELPSLRLLPIDFPDYNSIDSIDSQNVLRLSVWNKLQTKRKGEIDNLVNWGLYTDWRIRPRSNQGSFADLYSDMDLKPRSWLVLNSEFRYNLDDHYLRAANHAATFVPNETWSATIGHRYFREDPLFGINSGNNLIFTRLYYKLNENWALRISHHFEARDGTLEEQYYTIYRDFRSWTSALTFRMRANRGGQDDYAVALTFSLKAFPRFKQGADRDTPSLLLGG
jgi:LPS-assembly protein